MARGNALVGMLTDFIRRNPKTSATIAFNLGIYAAMATKKGIGKNELKELPGKLVDLVPSMSDIKGYVPMLSPPSRSPKSRKRRVVRARKPAKRRSTKRKAA